MSVSDDTVDLDQLRAAHDDSVGRLLAEASDWPLADVQVIEDELTDDPGCRLYRLTLLLCEYCVTGAGGQCHSPGCAMWIRSAPDVPITTDADGGLIRLAVDRD